MKRMIPTVIAISVGIIVLLDFFLDNFYLNLLGQTFANWAVILAALALILGVLNLLIVHFKKIRARKPGWGYSILLVLVLWIVMVLGLMDPAGPNGRVAWIFDYVQYPLQATMFSLLAVLILTAAYRAFRIRRWESLFFVLSGLVVLLGVTPLGEFVWDGFADVRTWIMTVPAMAGARGIIIGVALATIIMGLRLLLGMDRPYAE